MTSGWRAHIKRIGGVLRALRERGQSETLGVALLTGIVLILVALVGLFLFADFGADDEEQLLANIDGDVEATNITLSHEGGDTFEPGKVNVQLTGDAERNYTLEDDFDAIEGGGDRFAPGDAWETSDSGLIIGDGRMLVIHQPSNTILLDQPYSIEEDGVDLAVEHHPTGNLRSDSATVHGNASWTYEISATLGGVSYDEGDDGIDYNISFDYQSGTDKDKINWYDDGNHEIEVGDIDNKKKVTANATIYREDGTPLNETGEVELTVKPEPTFSVNIEDVTVLDGVGSLSVASGEQFGTESMHGEDLVRGDSLSVNASIENTDEAAVATQEIDMWMQTPSDGMMDGPAPKSMTLEGGETDYMTFQMEIPPDAEPGQHTMKVASEDDTATLDIMVNSLPNFEVDIVNIDDPVASGGQLTVETEIENTGTLKDTQEVEANMTTAAGNEIDANTSDLELDGGETANPTFQLSHDSSYSEGVFDVSLSSANETASTTAAILELVPAISNAPGSISAESSAYPEDLSFDVKVNHSVNDLKDKTVETTVTVDVEDLGSKTFDFEFDDSAPKSKTEPVTFEAGNDFNYDNLGPQSYSIDVSESATGNSDNTDVTVRKVVMDVSFTSVPNEIDVGEDLTVDYEVSNTGNLDQDATVQLVENGSSADVVRDSDSYTDLNDDTRNGELTFTSSDIDAAGFGAGDTIGLTLKAVDGGSVLANAEESVDIAPLDGDDFDMTITNTNSPVNEGEDVEITTEVVPDLGVLSGTVGTNAVLDDATLEVSLGELGTKSTTIDVLQGGTTETLTFSTGSGDAGTYTATATLLGIGANDTKQIEVEPKEPNLQFDYVNAPNQLTIGSTSDLTVDYQVTNVGNAEASATIALSVDKTTGNEATDALNVAPGDSASGTLTYSDFANEYNAGGTISWTVDIPDHGQETGTTSVAGDPANFDVTILGSNDPDAGNQLSVGVEVNNTGDKTGDVDVSLNIPGFGSDTKMMQDVTGDELRTHTFTFGTSSDDAGKYTATADTGDNTDTTQVTIEGANIQITSASGPPQISPGDDLNIDYTLENVGTKDGTESFVDLYIDGSLGPWDDGVTVPAGGTESGTLTFSDTGDYSDGDSIDWTVELYDSGDSYSGNTAVSGSGGGGGGSASFAVNIQSTNSPVKEGDMLNVNVGINNIGDASGIQTISLKTGGLGSDSMSVSLGSGSSTTETLSVQTLSGDAGGYTATVSSENDSDSESVKVNSGAAPPNFNVQIDSIAGQSFNPEVEVPAGGTTVDVDYTVENTGGKDGSTPVKVYRNGNNVGTGSETVPSGQTRSDSFSVSIGDSHISGNGINIKVTTSDDSDSETVETKALRIVSHSVDDTVHPFLAEELGNITTGVQNIGSQTASDTLIADVFSSNSQTEKSITVFAGSTKSYDMGLEESNFGETGYIDAKLDTYGDEESSFSFTTFDVRGDIWVDQSYIDQLDIEDDSSCTIACLGVNVDYTLDVPWSGYVEDGFNRIDGHAFRLTGDGSIFGDIGFSDTTGILTGSNVGSNFEYTQTVTEILGSNHYYQQFIHFFTDNNDNALEYEFDDITKWYWSDTTYCGISKDMTDYGGDEYGTPSDPGNGIDLGDAHITVQSNTGNNQCDRLTDEGGFLDP